MKLSTIQIVCYYGNQQQRHQEKPSEFYDISGDWDEQAKILLGKYRTLTSKDVKYEAGKETDLFKRLVPKLDKNLNEIIYILKANQQTCCKNNF